MIDAAVCAHAGSTVDRKFRLAQLPRMQQAGAGDGTAIEVKVRFSTFEGHVAIDGRLEGVAVLTCQRCMKPVEFPLHEDFKVVIVDSEAELSEEPGGYEPVLGNPARFDLHALAEDQALLALPLVPRHESECEARVSGLEPASDDSTTQKPFGNLRDLLRK